MLRLEFEVLKAKVVDLTELKSIMRNYVGVSSIRIKLKGESSGRTIQYVFSEIEVKSDAQTEMQEFQASLDNFVARTSGLISD